MDYTRPRDCFAPQISQSIVVREYVRDITSSLAHCLKHLSEFISTAETCADLRLYIRSVAKLGEHVNNSWLHRVSNVLIYAMKCRGGGILEFLQGCHTFSFPAFSLQAYYMLKYPLKWAQQVHTPGAHSAGVYLYKQW